LLGCLVCFFNMLPCGCCVFRVVLSCCYGVAEGFSVFFNMLLCSCWIV